MPILPSHTIVMSGFFVSDKQALSIYKAITLSRRHRSKASENTQECFSYAIVARATYQQEGRVASSSTVSQASASSRFSPHISGDGCNPPQKPGRSE
ncbi:MAG: hypothetical protein P4L87_07080 [Formivibrio sp.]|nr:hypothetical protein [Formivibrio sp.]